MSLQAGLLDGTQLHGGGRLGLGGRGRSAALPLRQSSPVVYQTDRQTDRQTDSVHYGRPGFRIGETKVR